MEEKTVANYSFPIWMYQPRLQKPHAVIQFVDSVVKILSYEDPEDVQLDFEFPFSSIADSRKSGNEIILQVTQKSSQTFSFTSDFQTDISAIIASILSSKFNKLEIAPRQFIGLTLVSESQSVSFQFTPLHNALQTVNLEDANTETRINNLNYLQVFRVKTFDDSLRMAELQTITDLEGAAVLLTEQLKLSTNFTIRRQTKPVFRTLKLVFRTSMDLQNFVEITNANLFAFRAANPDNFYHKFMRSIEQKHLRTITSKNFMDSLPLRLQKSLRSFTRNDEALRVQQYAAIPEEDLGLCVTTMPASEKLQELLRPETRAAILQARAETLERNSKSVQTVKAIPHGLGYKRNQDDLLNAIEDIQEIIRRFNYQGPLDGQPIEQIAGPVDENDTFLSALYVEKSKKLDSKLATQLFQSQEAGASFLQQQELEYLLNQTQQSAMSTASDDKNRTETKRRGKYVTHRQINSMLESNQIPHDKSANRSNLNNSQLDQSNLMTSQTFLDMSMADRLKTTFTRADSDEECSFGRNIVQQFRKKMNDQRNLMVTQATQVNEEPSQLARSRSPQQKTQSQILRQQRIEANARRLHTQYSNHQYMNISNEDDQGISQLANPQAIKQNISSFNQNGQMFDQNQSLSRQGNLVTSSRQQGQRGQPRIQLPEGALRVLNRIKHQEEEEQRLAFMEQIQSLEKVSSKSPYQYIQDLLDSPIPCLLMTSYQPKTCCAADVPARFVETRIQLTFNTGENSFELQNLFKDIGLIDDPKRVQALIKKKEKLQALQQPSGADALEVDVIGALEIPIFKSLFSSPNTPQIQINDRKQVIQKEPDDSADDIDNLQTLICIAEFGIIVDRELNDSVEEFQAFIEELDEMPDFPQLIARLEGLRLLILNTTSGKQYYLVPEQLQKQLIQAMWLVFNNDLESSIVDLKDGVEVLIKLNDEGKEVKLPQQMLTEKTLLGYDNSYYFDKTTGQYQQYLASGTQYY